MTLQEVEIKKAFERLKDFVKYILWQRIQHYGINPRVNKNTLINSKLVHDMKISTTTESLALEIASYWENIACGWARSHNFEGTYSQFIVKINEWVREKGLTFTDKDGKRMTQNQIAFILFKSFTENGIVGRPFMMYNKEGDLTKMIPELKEYMDKWFDDLFDAIMIDIDNYFNK